MISAWKIKKLLNIVRTKTRPHLLILILREEPWQWKVGNYLCQQLWSSSAQKLWHGWRTPPMPLWPLRNRRVSPHEPANNCMQFHIVHKSVSPHSHTYSHTYKHTYTHMHIHTWTDTCKSIFVHTQIHTQNTLHTFISRMCTLFYIRIYATCTEKSGKALGPNDSVETRSADDQKNREALYSGRQNNSL